MSTNALNKVSAGGPFSAGSVVCPYVVGEDSVEQVPAVGVKREGVEINKLNDLRFVLIFAHVASPFPVGVTTTIRYLD